VSTPAPLNGAHWPASAYSRTQLPERVLQFGTGMLLRAVCAASVDAANCTGAFHGRIVVVQSTPHGSARVINAQDGLFTLVERGVEHGAPVERTRLIGGISRALVAETEWAAVREVVARPELRVIVSNVTEAGFRLHDGDATPPARAAVPASFPAKLTDLLYTRFRRLADGPPLFVIPTELVPDNGPRLGAMVDQLAARRERGDEFRGWLARRVRFCSSLVDRITTGSPAADARAAFESRLGYTDALLTVTEPYCFWAVEADPAALHAAFPIDGAPESVVFAPDIGFYSERKLRLLNGPHTAIAPLALLGGVPTVRKAAEHSRFGPFLQRILFEEIVPATDLPVAAAESFARTVVDRFRNPWLDHEWRVIATNQTAKLKLRLVPSIERFAALRLRAPQGLALGCAAYLRFMRAIAQRSATEGTGWWRGETYPIADVDLPVIGQHWREVDPGPAPGAVLADTLERLAARVLADRSLWGSSLAELPGFLEATTRWLIVLERDGVDAALDSLSVPAYA
jgi:tagaturonate reductase